VESRSYFRTRQSVGIRYRYCMAEVWLKYG
jgi:hypothetical protein